MVEACRLGVLGPVAAWREGVPALLRGTTGRTVLARLALAEGRVVTIDQLTAALWDDDPPASATSAIHSAISRLRQSLGAPAVVSEGDGYRIDPDVVDVDVVEVDVFARAAASAPDPLDAADALREALSRWRGEPLADVADTQWAVPERARLAELRAGLLDRYHQARLDAGLAADAIVDLERDALAEPLREPTQLLLARALGEAGRTAEALRALASYRRALAESTGLDPSPAVLALEQGLLEGDLAPAAATAHATHGRRTTRRPIRRNWTPPDDELVGRHDVLAETTGLLARRRLVTVLGPGGIGKTRLAMELVARADDEEVVVVELATVPPGGDVVAALAGELGLSASGADVAADVAERLDLFGALLVVDNCEHVIDEVRRLVDQVMRRAPSVRVLLTSRRRLGSPEEHIVRLAPLAVPDHPDATAPSIRLLLDRAHRVGSDLVVDDAALIDAAAICRLVDGIPLAIELAASRAALLGLRGLRERLERSTDVLSLAPRASGRQATLDATIAWSVELLSPDGVRVFEDLSVFPDWFDVTDAEALTPESSMLAGLAELADSSLLVVERGHDRHRYRMLEPIRRHARSRAEAAGRFERLADAHAEWVRSLGDRMEAWWTGDEALRSIRALRGRRADLVTALAHLGRRGRPDDVDRLARQIGMVLIEHPDVGFSTLIPSITGPSIDGSVARAVIGSSVGRPRPEELADLERALAAIPDDDPRRHFLRFAFVPAQQYQGLIDEAVATCRTMIEDAETPPKLRVLAASMWALAEGFMGRFDEAQRLLDVHDEVLALSDVGGFVAYVRAEVAAGTDHNRALAFVAEAVQLSGDAPTSFVAASAKALHLSLLVHSGRLDEACELARDLAPELLAAGTVPHAWRALRALAHVLVARGDHRTAARVLATAELDPRAPVVLGHWMATITRQWALVTEALGEDEVARVREECTTVSMAELWTEVEAALDRLDAGVR